MKTHEKYINETDYNRKKETIDRARNKFKEKYGHFPVMPAETELLMRKNSLSDRLDKAIRSHFAGNHIQSKTHMKIAKKIIQEIEAGLKKTKGTRVSTKA